MMDGRDTKQAVLRNERHATETELSSKKQFTSASKEFQQEKYAGMIFSTLASDLVRKVDKKEGGSDRSIVLPFLTIDSTGRKECSYAWERNWHIQQKTVALKGPVYLP